ncbi:hypothetical protein ACTJK5_09500 [Agrobacterium sp. 22094]|uniref:hypothetical protein n=1 Tax=Agrobacterium sp. 22094 TaxID=3453872 RepID=UPI003F87C0AE
MYGSSASSLTLTLHPPAELEPADGRPCPLGSRVDVKQRIPSPIAIHAVKPEPAPNLPSRPTIAPDQLDEVRMQNGLEILRPLVGPRPPPTMRRREDSPVRCPLQHAAPRLERRAIAGLDETISQLSEDDIVLVEEVVDPDIVEDISVIAEN